MPMIVTDPHQPDNPTIFANRAFIEMTGYSAEELVGRNCRFLQGKDTDRATVAAIRESVAQNREFAAEILNYRKDGTSFWNALFTSPVFDEQGNLIFFFGSQLDVSRRRDAEDALRQAVKMEAVGQLTGGIAHDLNNLLQVMSGHLSCWGCSTVPRSRTRRASRPARACAGRGPEGCRADPAAARLRASPAAGGPDHQSQHAGVGDD